MLKDKFDEEFGGFKESKYTSKKTYSGLYKNTNLSKEIIHKEIWELLLTK